MKVSANGIVPMFLLTSGYSYLYIRLFIVRVTNFYVILAIMSITSCYSCHSYVW